MASPSLSSRLATVRGAVATGARATGSAATGALSVGAMAVGAVAVGAFAIGRLAIGRARIGRLEIDELVVHHLQTGGSEAALYTIITRLRAARGKGDRLAQIVVGNSTATLSRAFDDPDLFIMQEHSADRPAGAYPQSLEIIRARLIGEHLLDAPFEDAVEVEIFQAFGKPPAIP